MYPVFLQDKIRCEGWWEKKKKKCTQSAGCNHPSFSIFCSGTRFAKSLVSVSILSFWNKCDHPGQNQALVRTFQCWDDRASNNQAHFKTVQIYSNPLFYGSPQARNLLWLCAFISPFQEASLVTLIWFLSGGYLVLVWASYSHIAVLILVEADDNCISMTLVIMLGSHVGPVSINVADLCAFAIITTTFAIIVNLLTIEMSRQMVLSAAKPEALGKVPLSCERMLWDCDIISHKWG